MALLSEKARLLLFGVHKDAATLAALLDPATFEGIVISDDAAVYVNFTQAQKCWAHLLRKAIELTLVSKNGRCDVVPIVPDLLPTMRRLSARLSPSKRLVADGLGMRCVPHMETLYGDLDRAGIEQVDEYGRHADFHSFRYTFCRLMGEVLPIQKVKVLMRHATISLTADLYGKLGIDDLGEDVWSLPSLGIGIGDDSSGRKSA